MSHQSWVLRQRERWDRVRSSPPVRILTDPAHPIRLAIAVVLLAVLLGLGTLIVPRVAMSVALLRAQDDPAQLAELRLPAGATTDRINSEIDDALRLGDGDLAASFLDLADAQGVRIDPERRRRAEATSGALGQGAGKDFTDGFASGNSNSWFGTAGSFAADLVGVGDFRDLWQEGNKLYRGESYDTFVLGLSTAGVALTGITVASLLPSGGTSAAAKVPVGKGLDLLKGARKAGLLSRELVEKLIGMTREAVNPVFLKEAVADVRALDLSAARRAAQASIRPDALQTLTRLSEDTLALEARLGQRAAAQALNLARDAAEMSKIRRLAEGTGRRTRAVLKVLGPAAFLLGSIVSFLWQAVWLAIAWAFTAALLARRIGLMIGRLAWRPRGNRTEAHMPGHRTAT
ncbi:SRPBCC family protein [Methylobacterium sp. CM6257]